MLEFAGAIVLGLTLLFGALSDMIGPIDFPKLPKMSQAAPANTSTRTSLRAVDAETVSETEIIEP